MKVPLSWLKDYVDVSVSLNELCRRLTLAGLEVETVEYIGLPEAKLPWDPERIIVGEVLAVRPHPNADKLILAEVEYGGPGPETVVTGAPSLLKLVGRSDLHLKVAFAMKGARLWDPYVDKPVIRKLEKSKIRGIPSQAMVCSEKELGLSEQHVDIVYLPDDASIGMPLVDYLGDAVIEFDVKGPFGHLHSVFGIAREVAALLDVPLQRDVLKAFDLLSVELVPQPDFLTLTIADPDLCARYTAVYIQGVKVKPSPFWMQMRLRRGGMRPVNNIVDITNYVMLELGQPLHAFDYNFLRAQPGESQPTIVVRRAQQVEQMTTLDGELHTFDKETLLITDGERAVAVAGIMGGLESEITETTTDILLESANFHFLNIRRTSRVLGLLSESSQRFGRRVDPELTVKAAARAAHLMADLSCGTVVPVFADLYPGHQSQRVIEFTPAEVTRVLGVPVPRDEVLRILSSLEFRVSDDESETLDITVPSHRLDVTRPVDLIEEIGRIWGYDHFPMTLIKDEIPHQRANVCLEGIERISDILVGCGLDEVITYSLVDVQKERQLWLVDPSAAPSDCLRVINPLSTERAYLRQTLLPSLLNTVCENLRFLDRVAIFEVGAVYLPDAGHMLPDEPYRLSAVMTGPREPESWVTGQDRMPLDFYDLKGVVETLLSRLRLQGTFKPGRHAAFHPGRCAQICVEDYVLGTMGELHPRVQEAFELPEGQPVCALEFDLDVLLPTWGALRAMTSISVLPPVYEDLALEVDENVPEAQVRNKITQAGSPLVRSVILFDVYRGKQVGSGKKSLAFHLTYQANDHTLTDREVADLRGRIVKQLKQELNATLRGSFE